MAALRFRRPGFGLSVVLVAMLAIAGLVALPVSSALAHPLGNFTINRYARIEVYRDTLRVNYIVDYAEIPTFQLQGDIDTDLDGEMSQPELDAYALKSRDQFPANFDLTVNGQKVAVTPVQQSLQALPGQGGIPIVRAVYVYDAQVDANNTAETITFTDRNFADKAGWKEIVVRPSTGANVAVDPAFLVERSDALRSYPIDALASAPDDRAVSFNWQAGTGTSAPDIQVDTATKGHASTGLAGLLDNDGSIPIIVLSLFVAFVLGAQHAIGPGHGKSMVAAYLVGSRGKPRHAIVLGLTVTATHTSTVWLITLVTLVAAEFIAPDTLFFYLGVTSGVMVVVVGAALFITRLLGAYRRGGSTSGAHRHGWFGRSHSHMPAASAIAAHRHEHDHDHENSHESEDGHAHPEILAGGITWRSLFALGVSGGLLPCPSAIIVMLAAISFGKILFGMALVVAFSLGLAFVLSAIGIGLVIGKTASARGSVRNITSHPMFARVVMLMPILSAIGVMLAGLYITYEAWSTPL